MKLKLRMFGGKITRVSINICSTMENKRGEAWPHEETVILINFGVTSEYRNSWRTHPRETWNFLSEFVRT